MRYRKCITGLLSALLLAGCAAVSDREKQLNSKENLAARKTWPPPPRRIPSWA
jgi:uncharacterized lipoprotein